MLLLGPFWRRYGNRCGSSWSNNVCLRLQDIDQITSSRPSSRTTASFVESLYGRCVRLSQSGEALCTERETNLATVGYQTRGSTTRKHLSQLVWEVSHACAYRYSNFLAMRASGQQLSVQQMTTVATLPPARMIQLRLVEGEMAMDYPLLLFFTKYDLPPTIAPTTGDDLFRVIVTRTRHVQGHLHSFLTWLGGDSPRLRLSTILSASSIS